MHLAAYRFGKPYESLERNKLVHFMTGEPVAEVSQVGGAIVSRDLRKADNARKAILRIDPEEIQNTIDSLTEDLRLNTAISNAEMSSAMKDAAETMSTTNETPETEESNRDEISSNIETQNQQISDLMQPTLEQNQILSDIVSLLMADQNLNKRQLAALKSQQGNLYRGVG